MILSDKTIFKKLEEGNLIITPLEKAQVQPASVENQFVLATTIKNRITGKQCIKAAFAGQLIAPCAGCGGERRTGRR